MASIKFNVERSIKPACLLSVFGPFGGLHDVLCVGVCVCVCVREGGGVLIEKFRRCNRRRDAASQRPVSDGGARCGIANGAPNPRNKRIRSKEKCFCFLFLLRGTFGPLTMRSHA